MSHAAALCAVRALYASENNQSSVPISGSKCPKIINHLGTSMFDALFPFVEILSEPEGRTVHSVPADQFKNLAYMIMAILRTHEA